MQAVLPPDGMHLPITAYTEWTPSYSAGDRFSNKNHRVLIYLLCRKNVKFTYIWRWDTMMIQPLRILIESTISINPEVKQQRVSIVRFCRMACFCNYSDINMKPSGCPELTQINSVKLKMVSAALGKSHMRSFLVSQNCSRQCSFWTVPVLVWMTLALSHPSWSWSGCDTSPDLTLGINAVRGECALTNQMVLWVTIRCMKSSSGGGLHMVVTEVVPVDGGVDRKK